MAVAKYKYFATAIFLNYKMNKQKGSYNAVARYCVFFKKHLRLYPKHMKFILKKLLKLFIIA